MTDFIIEWIARGGYLGIFLLMALENIVPPIPSEVIMGLGGMAAARGHMALVPLILWGTAGTTVGNLFWYEIGRRMGISAHTVTSHVKNCYRKLDVHSGAAAVMRAVELGVLGPRVDGGELGS